METVDDLERELARLTTERGKGDVLTIQVLSRLVAALLRDDRYAEAADRGRDCVELRTRANGADAKSTQYERRTLATATGFAGDAAEALRISLELLPPTIEAFGTLSDDARQVRAAIRRWAAASGTDVDPSVVNEPSPVPPPAPASTPLPEGSRDPVPDGIERVVRDMVRDFGSTEIRWFEVEEHTAEGFVPHEPSWGFGYRWVPQLPKCNVCERLGYESDAHISVDSQKFGPGVTVSFDFCMGHAKAFNDLLVGDGSGLIVLAATQRAQHHVTTLTHAVMSKRDLDFKPDHVMYYEHDNDIATCRGRSGFVVAMSASALRFEYAVAVIDGALTSHIHVPHGPRSRYDAVSLTALRATGRWSRFRGVFTDPALKSLTDQLLSSTAGKVGAGGMRLNARMSVACLRPMTCRREHFN